MRLFSLMKNALSKSLIETRVTRDHWLKEFTPTWVGLHKHFDAWEKTKTNMRKLHAWIESNDSSAKQKEDFNIMTQLYTAMALEESHDAKYREHLRRFMRGVSFSDLSDDQKTSVRHALAETTTKDWSQEKRQKLNDILWSQNMLEDRFIENLRRDQKDNGIFVDRLGELRALPAAIKKRAKESALKEGIAGWWFEATEENQTAFSKAKIPSAFKKKMTIARNKVGVSSCDKGLSHNGVVLSKISELRREEAALYDKESYGAYAWRGNVFPHPRAMGSFLNKLNRAVKKQPKQKTNLALKKNYSGLTCTPKKAYEMLFSFWEFAFDIQVKETQGVSWLPGVQNFMLYRHGKKVGSVLLDLFKRSGKPSVGLGGFMLDIQRRHRNAEGKLQLPMSYVYMDTPSEAWSHYNVSVFFHEMGHVLHHLSCSSELPYINWDDIEGDAIEWPSLFMEEWAWDPAILSELFGEKGKQICMQYRKGQMSRSLTTGLQVAWVDYKMHASKHPRHDIPALWFNYVKDNIPGGSKLPAQDWARWEHLTIMRGTYIGYLWSEMLSARLYKGVKKEKNQKLALHVFYENVLAHGGRSYAVQSLENWMPGSTKIRFVLD